MIHIRKKSEEMGGNMLNKVTIKAPAKINLTLDVIGEKPDGYHELRMIMQTIDLCDEIFLPRPGSQEAVRTVQPPFWA